MASGAQLIQFPFLGGIDEGTRDEVMEPGAWATLENVRQNTRSALYKRYGFTALSTSRVDASTPTTGYRLFASGDSAVRLVDGQAEAYSTATSRWGPLKGRLPECVSRIVEVATPGRNTPKIADVVYCNGYLVCASVTTSGTFEGLVSVLDASTGAVVRASESLDTSVAVTSIALGVEGNYVIALWNDNITALKGWYIDLTSAATITTGWVSMGTVVAAAEPGIAVTSMPDATSPCIAVVYVNSAGGTNRLAVARVDHTGVLETATIDTNSVTPGPTSIDGTGADTLWVAWSESNGGGYDVRVCGFDPNDLTTVTATTDTALITGSEPTRVMVSEGPAGECRVWATDPDNYSVHAAGVTISGGGALAGTEYELPWCAIVCRPWYRGGRYYGAITTDAANDQNACVIVDLTESGTWSRPVANPAPGLSSPNTANFANGGVQTKAGKGASDAVWYLPLNITRSGVADGTCVVELTYDGLTRWQPAPFGNSTYLSGGLLSYTDGTRIAEAGFVFRPPKPTVSDSGTGITGTYRYVAVYEEVDADGNWCVSGVSDPSDSITVSNKTITAQTRPISATMRHESTSSTATGTRTVFYRTATGGEAPYYRLAVQPNDTSAVVVSVADSTSDATLTARAKLYSQPGVPGSAQDRRVPPSLQCLVHYNGMLVGAAGSEVWYSGQQVTGEGAWFNPVFSVPVPGTIVALAVMDGTLFVFTRDAIYSVNGEPPADNATSGGLGMPRRIGVDAGATSPYVCTTSLGTFYRSERGIEVLTRGQTVEWVGESVQVTLESFPVVTAMTLDTASSCVLIECASAETAGHASGTGRTLVYDLGLRIWTSIDRRLGDDTPATSGAVIPTTSGYRYAWLRANGAVYVEDRTTHKDEATLWVTARAVSPWIKASGMQGEQHVNRVLLLAKRATHHDVTLSIAYDYSATYTDERLYTADDIDDLVTAIPNQQLEHPMGDDARGQAVRIKLEDATPSTGNTIGTGQGATWIGLAFEVVPQPGAHPLPDEAR